MVVAALPQRSAQKASGFPDVPREIKRLGRTINAGSSPKSVIREDKTRASFKSFPLPVHVTHKRTTYVQPNPAAASLKPPSLDKPMKSKNGNYLNSLASFEGEMQASEGEQARTKRGEGRQYAVLHRHSIWWSWSAQWNFEGGDNLEEKPNRLPKKPPVFKSCWYWHWRWRSTGSYEVVLQADWILEHGLASQCLPRLESVVVSTAPEWIKVIELDSALG
ncbi:Sphingolipid C4-hydroxylase SUR2 [Fusarium oxysporum f. sp. albedinis]|nr:Sphingolipid C4-hydroxylase SUR2 [Fusarium oxysporum f. sp. albedinis]